MRPGGGIVGTRRAHQQRGNRAAQAPVERCDDLFRERDVVDPEKDLQAKPPVPTLVRGLHTGDAALWVESACDELLNLRERVVGSAGVSDLRVTPCSHPP